MSIPGDQSSGGWRWVWVFFCIPLAGCTPAAPAPPDLPTQHVLQNARTFSGGLVSAIVAGGEVNDYVNAVGARLSDAARASAQTDAITSRIHVDILMSSAPLEFTFGGEHVYLSTGAVRLCTSEEDLAAALAHVYAHLLDKHQQAHDQVNSNDLLTVADVLVRYPVSEGEELAADRDGFLLFARGGWDPEKYADAWSRLGGVNGKIRAQTISAWIGSSPKPLDEWRRPPVADRFTFHNIVVAAAAIPNRSDHTARLLMKCIKSCVGNDSIIERTAAMDNLESQLKGTAGGNTGNGPGPSHVW